MQWAVSASVVPVVLRHDELVKVDEREVLHAKHVAVEAVVERREESLCADLRLRRHVQLPLEDGESDTFGRGVPVEHARHLVGHGVVVEGEVGDAEQAVQLEELDQLARLVVHEVDGLDADAHRGRVYFVLGDRVVPVEHWHQVGRPLRAVFSDENAHSIRDWDVNDRRFRVIQGTQYKRGTVLEVPVLSDGPNRRLDDDDVALRAPSGATRTRIRARLIAKAAPNLVGVFGLGDGDHADHVAPSALAGRRSPRVVEGRVDVELVPAAVDGLPNGVAVPALKLELVVPVGRMRTVGTATSDGRRYVHSGRRGSDGALGKTPMGIGYVGIVGMYICAVGCDKKG